MVQEAVPEAGAVPGAVIAIQSFSDFMGFNPHLHVLGTDGCFYGDGMFRPALARLIGFEAGNLIFVSRNDPLLMSRIARSGPGVAHRFDTKPLEEIFRHKIFKMLFFKGKITQELVDMLMSWRHSGFNVFCGTRIQPGNEEAMENLARYIIRASFSHESPPWCDPFVYRRFKICIIPNLAFQVYRIGNRSGPGNDLYSREIQGLLPAKRWKKGENV